jgi:hypothetical protein
MNVIGEANMRCIEFNSHRAREDELPHERDKINNAPVLKALYHRDKIVKECGAQMCEGFAGKVRMEKSGTYSFLLRGRAPLSKQETSLERNLVPVFI